MRPLVTRATLAAWPLAAVLAAALPAAPAFAAGDPAGYLVHADVVHVSPRYGWTEVSEPVRRCEAGYDRYPDQRRWRDDYYDRGYGRGHYRRDDGAPAAAGLVGGLIGGLIGNQFGDGRGRTALTVAGAALGASIASDRARRNRTYEPARYAPVRRCTTSYQTRPVRGIDGYDVTYRYQGRTFTKWVHEYPGDTVPVHVAVEPAGG